MATVLITAFQPYDRWSENSSWLTLQELTKELAGSPRVTTRLYPVDFLQVRERLRSDLDANYEFALHLGQAPGASGIQLEAIGLNLAQDRAQAAEDVQPLIVGGPMAYRSQLPLGQWSRRLRQAGIPAAVSFHAGTYLCNAALYLSQYFAEQRQLKTRATFIHLPLAPAQVAHERQPSPSLPTALAVAALQIILRELAGESIA